MNKRSALKSYFQILNGEMVPKYLQSKSKKLNFKNSQSTKSLWKKHTKSNGKYESTDKEQSLFDLKLELAKRMFSNCHFCEHKCLIDRNHDFGKCKVKKAKIASEFLHSCEESVLVPSHTIFFSGCTFYCAFCQNWNISQKNSGYFIEPKRLAEIIAQRYSEGAKNTNWVGGDPTPNLKYILEVLNNCDIKTSQVWNSNMYCSRETMDLLNGIIDVYLTDFKYFNDSCAEQLSKIKNYSNIVKRNHIIAYNQGEVIIRHLVMPNHIKCCSKPIIKWISENAPNCLVNIVSQYRPEYLAKNYKSINRFTTSEEYLEVKNFAKDMNLNLI